MKLILFAWVLLLFSSCEKKTIYTADLEYTSGKKYKQGKLKEDEYLLIFFLSPQCPLSENYTKTINEITSGLDSANRKIKNYVVIPSANFSKLEIIDFINRYKIHPQVFRDMKNELAELLGATATPEVFLLNAKNEILYSGAIDNWAVDLGQKRQVITEHYLLDALDAVENHTVIAVKKTEPVGCFIEY